MDNANLYRSDSWFLTDVRAGWTEWTVAGFRVTPFAGVSNLLDVTYNLSVVVNGFGNRFFEPGPSRTCHAGASLAPGGE